MLNNGDERIDPDRLASTEFPLVRRGYDPEMVRTQLAIVAEEIRGLRGFVSELEAEIRELEAKPPGELDAELITEALGEEAGRVLEAARVAAVERAERAEAEATATIAAAERVAAGVRAEAEADEARLIDQANVRVDELIEEGRSRGREMVAEAQTVRERMLRDLSRKRQTHRAEVEQLRAARDRLLESLARTQHSLDESLVELVEAIPEAQAAAERAGLRVTSEPELTVEQLEAEIESARLVGHPLVERVPSPDTGEHDITEIDVTAPDRDEAVGAEPEPSEDTEPEEGVDVEGRSGATVLYDVERDEGEPDADVSGGVDVDADADVTGGADEVFARLRWSRQKAVAEAERVLAVVDEPEDEPADEPADEPDEPETDAGEPETDEPETDAGEFDDGAEPVDPLMAARAAAVEQISRSLKRVVVDEQGELLDGLRRDGVDAVTAVIADDTGYLGVLAEPLQTLGVAVAGPDADIDVTAAESSVRSLLLEPVRSHLRTALDDTDDPDELSTTVRAIYRECRSRRVTEAATAAVSAVYEVALGSRDPTAP